MFPVLFDKVPSRPYWKKVLGTQRANLLAYWTLWDASGTQATDMSGNGRHGTYSGPTLGQPGIGDGRTAPLFDGVNDFVNSYTASLDGVFSGAAGSIHIWIKVSSSAVWTDGAAHGVLRFGEDGSNRITINKTVNNNELAWFYDAGGVSEVVSSTALGGGTGWIPLAITWDKNAGASGEMKAYGNQSQIGATQTTLGTYVGALASTIAVLGALNSSAAFPWSGYLAHCAIWNTALSTAQISALGTV